VDAEFVQLIVIVVGQPRAVGSGDDIALQDAAAARDLSVESIVLSCNVGSFGDVDDIGIAVDRLGFVLAATSTGITGENEELGVGDVLTLVYEVSVCLTCSSYIEVTYSASQTGRPLCRLKGQEAGQHIRLLVSVCCF
jgi:hypothetical protein